MFAAILAIVAGTVLLSLYLRGALMNALRPFATLVGLLALAVGAFSLSTPLGFGLILAGLVLAMNTLYAVPSVGIRLKEIGQWLSHFQFPLGLTNLALGVNFLI